MDTNNHEYFTSREPAQHPEEKTSPSSVPVRVHSWGNPAVPLLFKDEVYKIVGAAIEVANTLGHGYLEKPYENALVVELNLRGVPVEQQRKFSVQYKNVLVGEYIPDLVAYGSIIVETKATESLTAKDKAQMLNYLKTTGLKVGVLLNFGKPKLEWERLVL